MRKKKQIYEAIVDLSFFYHGFLFHKKLGDLNGIGGGTLTDLIPTAPKNDTLIVGQILTDTTHEDQILIAGIQRHGILLLGGIVHQNATGSSRNGSLDLIHGQLLLRADRCHNGVRANHGNADAGAGNGQIGQVEDLAPI